MGSDAESQTSRDAVAFAQETEARSQSEERRGHNAGGWRAAGFTLGMEFLERLAYFGIGLNLVTYLRDHMNLSIPKSANIVTNFIGASYLTSLLGGFLADAYLGRYRTTVLGCILQLPGMALMVVTAMLRADACNGNGGVDGNCPVASGSELGLLYAALCMIGCGTGAVKSSVSGLGADQFEENDPSMSSYFNWFAASVSAGGVLSVTLLVYLQDNAGPSIGYGVSAACMLLALLLLLAGSPTYRLKPPSGSALTLIGHVLVAAFRNRHQPPPPLTDSRASSQFSFLNRATVPPPSNTKPAAPHRMPWRYCSAEKVEDVKMLIKLLPILATTVVYWTTNAQTLTFSVEQGVTLDRRLGRSFEIPPASLGAFLQLGILTMTPLYDQVIVPLARKWRRNNYGITCLQRIAIGLLISLASMAIAALVESRRLKVAHIVKAQRGGEAAERLPMSIFYLVPQFLLVGIGQAFAYVGLLDFFYRESPLGMRSLSTGLCLSTISLGFFLSSALVDCVNKWTKHGPQHDGWLTHDLDDGRLDYFYWFLLVLGSISFLAYLLCAHWYKYSHSMSDMLENHTFASDDRIVQSPVVVAK